MADLPDISHLTPEEREIIEGVMMRQKKEEEQENEIMRRKQDEVQVLEETIRARSEKHKKAGVELNATCHICLKTKFADGIGHICNYCNIRCCARCGGKVTLRSNKVVWVCIVCRKKQELLSKTGQWLTKGATDNAMLRRMQEDMQVVGPGGIVDQTQDKRPKLERAHSAAEKENLPLLQRSGSLLRRQYSQQEQVPGRRMSTSDSGVEMSVSPHSRTLPTPHLVVGSYPVTQTPRHPSAYPEDDPSLYRGEIDGLMRQHLQSYQRQRPIYQEQNSNLAMAYGQTTVEGGPSRSAVHPSQQHSIHQTQGVHPNQPAQAGGLQQQRSFSSSEEERSTPECASDEPDESEKGKGYYHHGGGPNSMSSGGRRQNGSHNGHHVAGTVSSEHNGHHPPREPRKEESTLVRRSFRRSGDEWRADSRRFTERRGKKTVRFDGGTNVGGPQEDWSWEADRQGSQDSATKDSGIDTSSTFTSSEDSNRGDLPKHPLSWQVSRDGLKIIGHMTLRKSPGSGSSSSILGLKVVGGKLLEDGSMGALIEKVKKGSTADIEGQLRPGDEVIKWNGRSLQGKSFREVYDIIAESRQEPQVELVVSRNLSSTSTAPGAVSTMPQGPTPSTPMASRRIGAQIQWRQKHETIVGPQQPHHKELYDARREKPSVLVTSPGSPDLHAQGRGRHPRHPAGNANVGGNIQVKLGFDPVGLQLIVTLVCAAGLTPRSNGQPRNPYAKIFLLPDKSEKSKRRTKTLANTNDPRWNQNFVYNGIRRSELRKRALEITVWDYGRYDANDFLGEAVVELAVSPLDEEPEWHTLTAHGEHRHIGHYPEPDDMVITPVDCHLSPPSTTSRLSDSDTSECDITDCDVSREQRRTADGASISSIGSSSSHYSSPPPERELCVDGEHRSRRDMSPQGRKRAALMSTRDQPASISGYQTYRKEDIHRGMLGHRSHSAAPMDFSSVRYRGRSQSPTGHRSLSPPEHRSMPYSHGYVSTRFGSRSATATPTGSPKKRQLPQIPAALKERVAQDLEERARFIRHRNRQVHTTYRSTGMGGWERHYSGLSDSDLPSMGHDPLSMPHSHAHRMHRPRRGHLSPDKDVLGDLGDSDMESTASMTSSAFSTQSERARGSRGLIPTVKNVLIPGVISPMPPPPRRNRRRHRLRVPCSECHCPNNNNNNPTKPARSNNNNPSKHNPTSPHPLVRSKSAVVRSLYRKMRTPFTRSQTVDENMLRYYSPETSEYTVSEGYILKPEELTGSSRKRIPEIYVEDCLQVAFNERLLEKFRSGSYSSSSPYRLESGSTSRRRSRSWQDRTAAGRSSRSRHHHNSYYHHSHNHHHHNHHHQHNHHQQQHQQHHNLRQHAQHLQQQHHHQQMQLNQLNQLQQQQQQQHQQQQHILLSSCLGADDLDVVRNVDVSLRPRRSFLFSKARSFDYDVPHDTFGNRFGTRLGAATSGLLSRRAKSFEYETLPSNIFSDDSLRTARRKLKRNLSLSDSGYGDKIPALGDQSKSYWDSNGDEKPPKSLLNREPNYDYLTNPDFLGKPFYGYDSELSAGETEIYVPSFDKQSVETVVEARDYLSSYDDSDHADLTTKRKYTDATAGYLGHDSSFDLIRATEKRTKNLDDHIYCSIDEALASANNYDTDGIGTRIPGTRSDEEYDSELSRRRRRKGIDSYLGSSDYEGYEDWEYDEGFVDRRKVEDYDHTQFEFDDMGDYYREPADRQSSRAAASYRRKRTAQFDEPIDDYPRYRSAEGYEYGCAYEDGSSPRRRRRRSRRESREAALEYENLRRFGRDSREAMYGKDTLSVPTFFESKRMMLQRAESTPILHSDEDLSSSDRARRLYRRRRNSSCPESRELGMYERGGGGVEDDRTSRFVFDSEEEFGSMETVVGADYYRRRRIDDERSYAGYVDPRSCEECRECRERDCCRRPREVRSSLRSSQDRYYQSSARDRRKSSCPECREMAAALEAGSPSELGRSGSLRRGDERRSSFEGRSRYRRRNSSCPEARDLELLDKKYQQQQQQQQQQHQQQQQEQQYQQQQQQYQRQDQRQQQERGGQAGSQQRSSSDQAPAQQQGSKRNVAISDTLEYYEYSMESESQCSENCGFGPCDPRRPRNRAPRPGNANSSLFDSQTATSDTAKNYHPRAVDHHENPRNTKTPTTVTTRDRHHHHHHHHHHDHGLAPSSSPSTPPPPPPPSGHTTTSSLAAHSARRHSGRKKTFHDGDADGYIDERRGDDDGRERRSSSMPESSEYSGQSGSYEKQSPSSRHQVTDNGHDEHGKRAQFTRSLSNADVPPDEKADGSLSDTAVGLHVEDAARRGRKSSPGSKSGSGSSNGGGSAAPYQSGLGKKSNSTSQLSATVMRKPQLSASVHSHLKETANDSTEECGGGMLSIGGGAMAEARGLGFAGRKRNSTPSSIQRSEEIMPIYQRFDPTKQGSAADDTAGSLNSISSSEGSSWSPSLRMAGETGQLRDFIEDLGPGQVVGRQALGARCLGEIQLSLSQKKGYLEVEVVRAKDLKAKHGSKVIPASYVKVYLVNGKKCIAKAKTPTARKTLDPFFQRSLVFKENCQGCILQVTVWGDYGRFEGKKVFMGVAQIVLDELDLNQIVFAWYKLFGSTSL